MGLFNFDNTLDWVGKNESDGEIFYGYNNKNIMKKGAINLIWILIQESGNAVLTYRILL